MENFEPEYYVIKVAMERDGIVVLGHTATLQWRGGDVRLV
jgi:hypothetical protein